MLVFFPFFIACFSLFLTGLFNYPVASIELQITGKHIVAFSPGLQHFNPNITYIRTVFRECTKFTLLRIVYRSEEHTSELQSLMRISYAVFCLTQKTQTYTSYA